MGLAGLSLWPAATVPQGFDANFATGSCGAVLGACFKEIRDYFNKRYRDAATRVVTVATACCARSAASPAVPTRCRCFGHTGTPRSRPILALSWAASHR